MFKKIFGPKKREAQGSPVALEELKGALMACFPQEGKINQYLNFETNDKVHEGFAAVWEYYMADRDDEGIRRKYLMTFTVNVDIRGEEKAVYLKTRRFTRPKRVPKGTEVLDPWFVGIGIGDVDTIMEEFGGNFKVFRTKKKLEVIAEKATSLGWDAYL